MNFSSKTMLILCCAASPVVFSLTPALSAAADFPAHRSMLSKNEQALATLEKTQTQIGRTRGDEAKNALAATYEQQQLAYVNSMQEQHDVAITDVQKSIRASASPAYSEAIVRLNDFEMLAQRHEKRTATLTKNAETIEKGGKISYRQSGGFKAMSSYSPLAAVHDFMFPPAHAAIALTVYNACKKDSSGNVNTAACIAASAKGLSDSAAAKNTFNSCWASHANVKPNWVRAVRRAACTAALTIRLA